MSAVTHVRFYPSDWLAGTRGMTAAETGVYITMIAMMYERGGPIRHDDKAKLARLCGTSASTFKTILDSLISDGKITVSDAGISNRRVEAEIENVMAKSKVARGKAEARWTKNTEKSTETECCGNAESMLANSQYPVSKKDSYLSVAALPRDACLLEARTGIATAYQNAGHLPPDTSRAGSWLASGFTTDEIVSVVSGVLQRGTVPSSLKYFDRPLADLRTAPRAPPRASAHIGKHRTANDYLSAELRKINDAKSGHNDFAGITIDASPG